MARPQTGKIGKYDTSGPRTLAIRVYVNNGEKKLIKDALKASRRIPRTSDWMATLALNEACKMLDLTYPYPPE